ncbi:MAG: GldG family protein, partial [Bacteroidota bacterium]
MKFLQKNLQLLLIAGLLIAANLILSSFFLRIDLTQEKRYSLADITLQTAEELEVPMTITVYLEGDFPPNIREFQEAIRTTLLEIKQYAGSDFAFNFVDPSKNPELLAVFRERGFAPIPVKVRLSTTETKEQYMWPILVLRYRDRELYVDLLKGTAVMTPQGPNVNFAKAESDLEYKITSAMRSISRERGGLVALLQGHGEVAVENLSGLGTAISNQYTVGQLDLSQVPNYEISPSINVLVVLQPTLPFSERDKYEIDQYLMRGGSILWVMDLQEVDLNLYRNQSTLTQLRELNLDDMFMNYGLKLNYDLIQDLECEATEVFQPESRSFVSKKWLFSPLALEFPE